MGTSWAVGAATTLALFAVVSLSPAMTLTDSPFGPTLTFFLYLLLAAALALWAYALALGSYGNKGALVALLVDVLAAGAAGAAQARACGPGCVETPLRLFDGALVLVALLSAWALVAELRARRGPIFWWTAAVHGAPMLAVAAIAVALAR